MKKTKIDKKIKRMIERIKSEYGLKDENLKPLLDRLTLKSTATQETYLIFFKKWLKAGGVFDDDTFLRVLHNESDNSRATAYYSLKFIYKSYGEDAPYSHSEVVPKGVKKKKELLDTEEVIKIIEYTKKKEKDLYKKGIVVLSTIYGLRRIEMYRIERDDIDLDNKKIFIFTAKGGELREHIIPDDILPYIAAFKKKIRNKPKYIQELNYMFDEVANYAGIPLRPRLGWHSIRRRLITELMQTDLNPNIIRNFMRWKGQGADILQEYTLFNPEEVDRKVFEKHPFLEYWS